MKYRNWRSFLNKSLLVTFMYIFVFIKQLLFTEGTLFDKINNFFHGNLIFLLEYGLGFFICIGILIYGIILLIAYLSSKGKYLYLLWYGLIYFLLGCTMMFLESLYIEYIDYIILSLLLIHGLCKCIFRSSYSKLIYTFDILIGLYAIIVAVLCLLMPTIINLYYLFMIYVFLELVITIVRLSNDKSYIKAEIEEETINNKAILSEENIGNNIKEDTKRSKKDKERKENVEVIDLERFFKVKGNEKIS